MRAVLFFIIGLAVITTAAAASDWEEHSVTLKWGESVSVSGYNITAVDFSPGTVEEPTNKTKCIDEPDAFKRKAWGCDDYVILKVFKNGNYVLDAALAERNHTFVDGAEFFNETVYEDGDSSLRIIALDVVTGRYIPSPYAELKIMVKGNDEFDMAGNFTIVKTVPAEAHVNPSSQFIPVSLAVKNIGPYDFQYIWVNDSVQEGLISKPQELGWGIPLKKGETWEKDYLIEPLKPVAGKEYTLPPAVLYVVFNNRTYNLSTGNSIFTLHSSEIIVTKTADKTEVRGPGNVTVNISVKNNGSRAAQVKVRDSLAPDTQIMGGELDFSTILQPGESHNNSYILKLDNISDNISLPYASFEFKEYWSTYDTETKFQANTGSGISNPVEIEFATAGAQVQNTSTVRLPDEESSAVSSSAGSSNSSAVNLSAGSSSAESSNNLSAEGVSSDSQNIIRSLWIGISQFPFAVLALLAGGLLAVLMLRIWRPGTKQHRDKP
ncbi:Uncharacterised protein [uncultured archaeon]|nr:Uncharacterised protein [uncultured archaeon]